MHQMHSDKMIGIKFDILKLLSKIAALEENMETYYTADNQWSEKMIDSKKLWK